MVNKNGSKLAFNLKLSIRSPFNNAIKALCMPQPGQSKPIKLFIEQVNKCCSKKLISVSNF
jgi:hypothetical protein